MKLCRQNNKKTNKNIITGKLFLLSLYFQRSMQTKWWATLEGLRGHAGTEATQARPVPLWNICPVGNRAAWPALQIGPLWQKCPCGTVTSSLESGGEPHFLIVTQWTQTYQSSLSQSPHCVLKHLKFYLKSFTKRDKLGSLFIYIDYRGQIGLNNAF